MSAPVDNCPNSPIGRHGMMIEAGTVIDDSFVFICEFCLRTWILHMDPATRATIAQTGLICPSPAWTP